MAQLINEAKRMQLLAGLINESQLNEDILELKQMSKQLYSFLKKKGFPVELTNQLRQPFMGTKSTITTQKSSIRSEINVEPVQIIVTEGTNEMVTVAVSPSNVARILVGGGGDWTHKAAKEFGNSWDEWKHNPKIKEYVNKLGNELLAQIKTKYPDMAYTFEQQNFLYLLHFGYAQTKKGGKFNPNQRPNAPKPAAPAAQPQQESLDIDAVVNEALAKVRKNKK